MAKFNATHIDPSVLDAAATWQARLSSGSATDQDIEQHMEWLLADPIHIEADEFMASTMKGASEFEVAARAAFAKDFEAKSAPSGVEITWTRLFSGWQWPQYGLASAVVAVLFLFVVAPNLMYEKTPSELQVYTAQPASVEIVQLADGSSVSLFGGSEISVLMAVEARVVELTKGRAFFDVTSDKTRPFYVNTGARQVKVVGTRFEVFRGAGFEQVAVNEGLVSVDIREKQQTPEASSTPVLVEPGMVAFYAQGAVVPKLSQRQAEAVGAWAEGVLIYKEAPLADIVAAINDLFPNVPIILGDEKLAALPFSGTLVVSSSVQMAQQLGEFLALDVRKTSEGIMLVSR